MKNERLVEYLKGSSGILIFTGAGVSTSSGIRDFRGPKGLWKTQSPVYYDDFMRDGEARVLYWRRKLEGWESFRDARPGRVHEAVVRLEKAGKLRAVVTQNIDGLHSKAGTSGRLLVELHGTMRRVECQTCGKRYETGPCFEKFEKTGNAPLCACGGFLKPATISFGQDLNADDLRRGFRAAEEADLIIALGSTLSVTPAADIPLRAAQYGKPYVIINSGRTAHDGMGIVSLRIEGDVDDVFPDAVDEALDEVSDEAAD